MWARSNAPAVRCRQVYVTHRRVHAHMRPPGRASESERNDAGFPAGLSVDDARGKRNKPFNKGE